MNRTDPQEAATPGDVAATDGASGNGLLPAQQRPRIARPVKLPERIAAAIVSDIVSDGLRPGDRLPIESVMRERFQVGRASLREALRILEVHGLISLRSGPGGGPIVTAVNPRDVARTFSLYLNMSGARMHELVQARIFIEPMVARMAVSNRDPASLKRLEEAMAYEASIPPDDERYIEAANNFHYTLTTMTGNRVVDLLATALKELYTTRVVSWGVASRTTEPSIRNEHREIGEAILAGDAGRAEELMRQHVTYYLERMEADPSSLSNETVTWG
jgi:GntR family transcriptional repressor for pyruvate dehydrogenase complex